MLNDWAISFWNNNAIRRGGTRRFESWILHPASIWSWQNSCNIDIDDVMTRMPVACWMCASQVRSVQQVTWTAVETGSLSYGTVCSTQRLQPSHSWSICDCKEDGWCAHQNSTHMKRKGCLHTECKFELADFSFSWLCDSSWIKRIKQCSEISAAFCLIISYSDPLLVFDAYGCAVYTLSIFSALWLCSISSSLRKLYKQKFSPLDICVHVNTHTAPM